MKEPQLDFIPDLPKGPLDEYRELCPSVNWKRLKVYLEGEDAVRVKYRTYQIMESTPLFDRARNPNSDEQKHIAAVQMMKIKDLNMFPPEIYSMDFRPRVSSYFNFVSHFSSNQSSLYPFSTVS